MAASSAQARASNPPYRSGIYFSDAPQRPVLDRILAEANNELGGRVVTEVEPVANYSTVEPYHRHYFASNPDQGNCADVIGPRTREIPRGIQGAAG